MSPIVFSIRGVNLGLVFTCIVVTAVLCTGLSMHSANQALSQTKQARDDALSSTYAVIQDSTEQLKEQMMHQLTQRTHDAVDRLLTINKNLFYGYGHSDGIGTVILYNNGTDYDAEAGTPSAIRTMVARPERVVWTSPTVVGMNVFLFNRGDYTSLDSAGAAVGTVATALTTDFFTTALSSMDIGGRSRIFITVKSSWSYADLNNPLAYIGYLLGVSHGNATNSDGPESRPLKATNATDEIIRHSAQFIEGVVLENDDGTLVSGYNALYEYGKPYEFHMGEDVTDTVLESWYAYITNINDQMGTDWWCTVVVDRQHILGSVDEQFLVSSAKIDAVEEEVDNDLQQSRTILYVVLVLAAAGMIVASACFVFGVTAPLITLKRDMYFVSKMKLDMVDLNQPLSRLSEVREMQACFDEMLANLKVYRDFMPASVLQETDSETENDRNLGTSNKSGDSHGAAVGIGHSGSSDLKSSRSKNSGGPVAPQGLLSADVRTKEVTFAVVNTRNFLQLRDSQTSTLHLVVNTVSSVAKELKGIADTFVGDRLTVAWNAIRYCPMHQRAAVTFANKIRRALDRSASFEVPSPSSAQSKSSVQLTVAVASGAVKCGNMGGEGLKKYNFVGSLHTWVHLLERLNRLHSTTALIDSRVQQEVASSFFTRAVDCLTYAKHSQAPMVIYE
eukprot:gene19446-29967_t